jgi:hypothetical protein
MVKKDASLRAIRLIIVLMVHDGLLLLQEANRHSSRQLASAAGETTQRALSLYAQAATPYES